jgi:hypothetical protein
MGLTTGGHYPGPGYWNFLLDLVFETVSIGPQQKSCSTPNNKQPKEIITIKGI